jgi:hypothetical protein
VVVASAVETVGSKEMMIEEGPFSPSSPPLSEAAAGVWCGGGEDNFCLCNDDLNVLVVAVVGLLLLGSGEEEEEEEEVERSWRALLKEADSDAASAFAAASEDSSSVMRSESASPYKKRGTRANTTKNKRTVQTTKLNLKIKE